MQIRQRFQSRTALMDEKIGSFLKIVTELGGYCTLEQAKALELANSNTRVLAHLRGLERAGFVRRVADYPVVCQITGATTRLLDRDRRARRVHDAARVRSRLLAVSFYLEARLWPADFAFDHQHKIDTVYEGCPIDALPQRGGKPYLWEELVLWHDYNRIGVAIMDDQQRSPLSQLKGFARGFSHLVVCLGKRLRMLIVTGAESRHLIYCRLVHHPAVMKFSPPGFAITIEPYQMRNAPKSLQLLPHENSQESVVASQPEPQQPRRRTSQFATPATVVTEIVQKAVTRAGVTSGTVPLVTPVPSKAESKFPVAKNWTNTKSTAPPFRFED